MKKYSLIIAVLFLVLNIASGQIDYQQQYEHKIHTFTKMTHAGWTMAGIGSGLTLTGFILIATVPGSVWNDDNNTNPSEPIVDVFQAFAGIITMGVGVGLLAGGITMGSIGSHKVKSYKSKLDNLSFGLICTPKKQGILLTYRF